ncbi:purine-cytosine permease family protein [Inquilinus sp.]|jgi:NCS1 family nucleobase:cation symporter-1|uniref:purine-cytosine permease family protein n=1 Tax=Inquilinus sp. TaxID=1932117 RepID=UPI0037837013
MTQDRGPGAASNPIVERRAIDHIPVSERHGRPGSQFTLWIAANLQITAVITGALAVVLGGDVVWSLAGLLIGQALGGAVMALHGAQGPRLGLPQMISSRVQFGVWGAAIPIVLVCVMYIGFSATGTVLSGQALSQLLGVGDAAGIVIFAAVVVVFAVLGYRVIHAVGRVASVVGIIAFAYMFGRLLVDQDIGALLANQHFVLSKFLLAISLSASWQIAYGPYVADYSRYLPEDTPPRRVFWMVWLGSVIGSQVAMTFGVFAAALAGDRFGHGQQVAFIVGLGASGTVAALLYLSIAFGKITITTLNAYGSVMSLATIVSGFRGNARLSQAGRLFYVLLMIGLTLWLALAERDSFLKQFSAFLLFLLTFFTPWSAINLVDYYFINKEHYDIQAISDPDGRYGRWNVAGIACYVIGIVVQIPFIDTPFYTGGLVSSLDGVDISWIVGLAVPAVLYYLTARRQPARG